MSNMMRMKYTITNTIVTEKINNNRWSTRCFTPHTKNSVKLIP